jgi:hypothetical protein
MLFDWLKRMVKNAFLAGINEAIAEVSGATASKQEELPASEVLLLPYHGPESKAETGKGRRKAE